MKSYSSLPPWMRAKLESPPAAGTGIHQWIYHCACKLKSFVSDNVARDILVRACQKCGRPVTLTEINDAIANATSAKSRGGGRLKRSVTAGEPASGPSKVLPKRAFAGPDWDRIRSIASRGERGRDLVRISPDRQPRETGDWLRLLFPGDPLLCMARSLPKEAMTRHLSQWTSKFNNPWVSLLVPSAMTAPAGRNLSGQVSKRCLDNTGARQYLVVEFDFKLDGIGMPCSPGGSLLSQLGSELVPRNSIDLCAGLLLELKRHGAPLLLAVHSGGKSIHGWFPVADRTEAESKAFFSQCLLLGADRATWTRCQLVRMPGGVRLVDGKPVRQTVLYFDPSLLPKPLSSCPP